jgi:hypothetical protein
MAEVAGADQRPYTRRRLRQCRKAREMGPHRALTRFPLRRQIGGLGGRQHENEACRHRWCNRCSGACVGAVPCAGQCQRFQDAFLSSGKVFRPARHHRNFNKWWPFYGAYGGLYGIPPYDSYSYGNYAEPGPVVFVSQPPIALTCQKSKEIKTAPSESGGTREITITRC